MIYIHIYLGLHISLGVHDISSGNLPNGLIVNKKVEFKIGDIISFRSIRPVPQNIPGQFTNEYNLRYYPTRWLFAEVTFIDFDFPTRYPPHISIACIAVQLNVDHVDKFEKEYKNNNNNHNNVLLQINNNNNNNNDDHDDDEKEYNNNNNNDKEDNNYYYSKYYFILILFIILILLFPFPLIDILRFNNNNNNNHYHHNHHFKHQQYQNFINPFPKFLNI